MTINVKVLGDSSRLALDLCVGRLFRQTRVKRGSFFFGNNHLKKTNYEQIKFKINKGRV